VKRIRESRKRLKLWDDVWLTGAPHKCVYPRLYGISEGKDTTIEEVVGWENQIWE